ncbi:hypothetical protein PSJ72_27155 [Escherichia coli]|nr:hypothetical protein [Escherichia coli]
MTSSVGIAKSSFLYFF